MADVIDQLATYRSRVLESSAPVTIEDIISAQRRATSKRQAQNRLRSAVAAAAVFAGLAGAWAAVRDQKTTVATDGDSMEVEGPSVGEPDENLGSSPLGDEAWGLAVGWHELEPGPLTPRSQASVTWTGSELLVLGGEGHNDGAAYDPSTRSWRSIAAPPFPNGSPLAVWTGSEVIAIGPDPDSLDQSTLRSVAEYDPATDTWRELAPVDPAAAHGLAPDAPYLRQSDAFWTGSDLLWAGAMMLFDRDDNRWETLPLTSELDTTSSRHIAWTGTQLILARVGADTLGFDLEARSWVRLGAPTTLDVGSAATWNGTELIIAGWWNKAEAFDPATGAWRQLPPPPNEQSICVTRALMQGGTPLFEICRQLYRFVGGRWIKVGEVTHDEPKATVHTQLVDTGDAVFLWASDGGPGDPANPDVPFTQFELWVPPSPRPATGG